MIYTERVADQVLPRVEGDAAARDVDDARRVRPLLVIVVTACALLERFSLVFYILLGARLGQFIFKVTRSDLLSHPLRAFRRSAVARLRKILSLAR